VAGPRVTDDADAEAALRRALVAVEEGRARELVERARAEALTEELQRLVGERPHDPVAEAAMEARVEARAGELAEAFRQADAVSERRLQIGDAIDKYALGPLDGPPCEELMPICGARCCSFDFALSSQDLDEGVIAWDRDRPYLIRHDATGACVHRDARGGCGVYHHRPAPCRVYDCRNDRRVWVDYEARVLAPVGVADPVEWSTTLNVLDRLARRDEGMAAEVAAVRRLGAGGDEDR
jgi:hypothetical protein